MFEFIKIIKLFKFVKVFYFVKSMLMCDLRDEHKSDAFVCRVNNGSTVLAVFIIATVTLNRTNRD